MATGPLPVISFSLGGGTFRESHTIALGNLASEGYFCVSIGHTYDTDVDFPDGEVVYRMMWTDDEEDIMLRVRAQDAVFALQLLADAAFAGRIPGLGPQSLQTSRVGMFGHSMGGTTTLEAMQLDTRIVGGVNIDGNFEGPQMTIGTDRPFLVVTAMDDQDPGYMSIEKTWLRLTGWKTELHIAGAAYMSFCDDATCYQMLNAIDAIDPNKKRFGTIDPLRVMDIQSPCLKALLILY
ncbi:MAG: hypothetical protein M1839_007148 [Geoglossum umbratile]|nr:MAG: hypothetical protein M1839_007148 [Geoglossum umbratile]